jgi:hypothetical protein
MRKPLVLGFSAAALLAAATVTNAADFFDNFDSYTTGSIQGKGGWAAWTGSDVSAAGEVTTARAFSGTQSLEIASGDDTVQTFTSIDNGTWSLTLEQFIPPTSGGTTWVILMNQYPNNLNWSVNLKFDMTAGTVTSAEEASASATLVKDVWTPLRFDIDLDASTVSIYYNNTFLTTHDWQNGGIDQLQGLDLYADSNQSGSVFYDQVRLTQVPEPSSLALLLVGGLAFLVRARKQA